MEGYTHQPLREKIKQDSYLRKFITDTDISQETLFCTHLLKNFFSHSFASSSQEKQKDYARFIEAVEKNIYADECAQIDFLFASIEFFEEKTIQHREDKDVVTTIPYYLDTTLQCTNDRNPEIAKHISLVKLLCTDIIAYHENAF